MYIYKLLFDITTKENKTYQKKLTTMNALLVEAFIEIRYDSNR